MKPFVVIEITFCSGLILMCSACTKLAPLEPSSAIVATVENAGAGNLSSLAAPQIEDWLQNIKIWLSRSMICARHRVTRQMQTGQRRPKVASASRREMLPCITVSSITHQNQRATPLGRAGTDKLSI